MNKLRLNNELQRVSGRDRRPAAFTLTELLIVVAVIAILAMAVVPYVLDSSDAQAVSATRLIASALQYAQNEAISSQTPVTVTFTPATETYELSNASGRLIHPISKKQYVVDFRSRRNFNRLNVVSAEFGGEAFVTFDVLGAPSAAGTITVQAGARTMTIAVANVTGLVTVGE